MKPRFRSRFEERIALSLNQRGVKWDYETLRIDFNVSRMSHYTPDFILKNGVIIEAKGRFTAANRTKHLLVRAQWSNKYDIRFVFQNAHAKLYKGSKTTYAQWCNKHGFKWAHGNIPDAWLKEKRVVRKG